MSKFSVKKPFTVFVAVIAVLVLGVIAYMKMTPDLLPNMDFPYVVVVTTYPGASPEKVEAEVSKPMEQAMSTLEHIKSVSSTSAENYSMLTLEFEEGSDLDVIGVDIQQSINALSGSWSDMVGQPYVLKINPSMLPIEVAAVSRDGMDMVQLTQFLDDTLMPKLEGISGVARITASGTVEQQLHVILDQTLIDKTNATITDAINQKMDEALQDLTKTKQELEDAKDKMDSAKAELSSGKDALTQQTSQAEAELSYQQAQLVATKMQLQEQLKQLNSGKQQLQTSLSALTAMQSGINELKQQIDMLSQTIAKLEQCQQQYAALQAKRQEFDRQIAEIRANAALTEEEKTASIEAIQTSPEYVALDAEEIAIRVEVAAYGLSVDTLQGGIDSYKSTQAQLQQRVQQMEAMLQEQGIDPAALQATIAELQGQLTQLEEGAAALEEGIAQIDSGMLELKDAAKLLNEKKLEGLLQLSEAASQIAVNESTVTGALTQLEGGIETLETTREQTLSQTDLNKILTLETVSSILTAQNFYMPAGYVQQDGISYMVSVGEEITDADTVADLVLLDLGVEGVEPVRLSDVAVVTFTDNRGQSYAKLDGADCIVLSFEKQSTYATAEATDNIAKRFAELEGEYAGLRFVSLMDQGEYIYMIVDTITNSLLLGALFAILILFVFLKDLRPTLITLCSIPVSVIFAIVMMYFSGVTINIISLSGLAVAVGMLVDNSVVVIENIYRLRAKGANSVQAAVSGAAQVAGAVTSSTLTTICVFLPIVFVEGLTRQLFTDLALTMTYALVASLIVSLTLVPAMAQGMLRKEKKTKDKFMQKGLNGYEKVLNWSLKHKAVVLIGSAALLVISGVWCLSKGFTFMPEMDMSSVNVTIKMPEDATMEEAVELADEVLERMQTLDEIESAGAMMSNGNALMGMMGGSLGGAGESYDVTVYVTLKDENGSGKAVGDRIVEMCADLPCEVTASSAMMDMSMLTGAGISLQLYSQDTALLENAAKKAAEALAKIEGVEEVTDGMEDAVPALHIQIDRNEAMKQGITVAQIYMELAEALTDSATATTLQLDGTSTDVIVEKPEGTVPEVADLEDFTISFTTMTGEEKTLRLGDVATVEHTTSLLAITRMNQRRYVTVEATLKEGQNVTLLTAEAERVIRNLDLGGVDYAFGGENEQIMEALKQLLLMLVVGILLVYLVMVAQFQSLKSPFIVMFTIPLAFTGGFVGLLACGMEFSVISMIGFVMLMGIIVNNGIVLVDYINQLRQEGADRRAAIVEAGRTRMRPILMTTITTVLGLIDMAVSRTAGTTLMQPVAVVCIGGLIYATLMTLFVVPCIYDMLNRKDIRKVSDEDLEILDI